MTLSTIEKFLLLAKHPTKGRFLVSDLHINYGIIGAALMEMSQNEEFKIENNRLVLNEGKVSTRPIISEITQVIRNSRKPRKLRYWMQKLPRKSNTYKWMALEELQAKGLIRIEHKRFLGLIPYKRTYLLNGEVRTQLILDLKDQVLSNQTIRNQDIPLLGIVESCKMHKIISTDKVELKRLRKEVKVIIKDSALAETLGKTIEHTQAAIAMAIIASTVVTAR